IYLLFIYLFVLAFVVVDALTAQRIASGFQKFLDWMASNLAAGFFAFVGVYFLATMAFMPGMILTLGAGVIFGNAAGLRPGVALASTAVFVGASAGAVASFLLGRYLFRGWVERKLVRKYPVIKALDLLSSEEGFASSSSCVLHPSFHPTESSTTLGE
ncbi:hypothetical protein ACHAWF_001291, partial [Thalassiosira exigua]